MKDAMPSAPKKRYVDDGGGQGGEQKKWGRGESREDFQAWFSLSTSSKLVNREGGAERSSHGG